jgi:hypothetical protein
MFLRFFPLLSLPVAGLAVLSSLSSRVSKAQELNPAFDLGQVVNTDPGRRLLGPQPPAPPGAVPPPPSHIPAQRQPLVLEEQEELRQEVQQEGKGIPIKVSGPETKGSTIYVDKAVIKLPSDAYVEHFIVHGECMVNSLCPQFPLYIIRRGNSTSEISLGSGSIIAETIAPGEAGAFNFLKDKLSVDSVSPSQR